MFDDDCHARKKQVFSSGNILPNDCGVAQQAERPPVTRNGAGSSPAAAVKNVPMAKKRGTSRVVGSKPASPISGSSSGGRAALFLLIPRQITGFALLRWARGRFFIGGVEKRYFAYHAGDAGSNPVAPAEGASSKW